MNTRNSFPDSIQIIRSKRRTLSLQVRHNGQVIVRAPYSTSLAEIEAFIRKNAGWLKLVGVQYGRITIRNQKTRWGSCSSKGNLNFNCLLMLAPPEVLDYVIVHELCHRKEMNHSPRFWSEVAKVIPDYKKHEKWLKTEGTRLMRRMTG